MDSAFEKKLIEKATKGDSAAFESLIIPYEKKVYNIALQMFKNEHDAYDAAQEVFMKVYLNIGKFKFESSFSTWLHRLAMNTCIDEYRKRKRHMTHTTSMEESASEDDEKPIRQYEDKNPTPEQVVLQNERVQEVREALQQMKEEQRIMIIYRDLQGMTYDEIAQICDCGLGTVKSRIARARKALKDIIVENREQIPSG